MVRKTSIFVSSTCYDLKHVRVELSGSIESLGHAAILSESGSFPIDPNRTTIENCIDVVNSMADVLVLIVGKRYGSTLPGGKSITNLEYESARIKGIPIYVFVDSEILKLIPIYHDNPKVKLKEIDNPKRLFDFVNTLRERHEVWCFPFNHINDICDVLRSQLSGLLASSLATRRYLLDPKTQWMRGLSPNLAFILISKSPVYDTRFLFEAARESIEEHRATRWLLQNGVSFERVVHIDDDASSLISWMLSILAELRAMVRVLSSIFQDAMASAMRPPGTPADEFELFVTAQSIGAMYLSLLRIAGQVSMAHLPEGFEDLRELLYSSAMAIVTDIEKYIPDSISQVEGVMERISNGETGIDLTLSLTLTSAIDSRHEEMDAILERLRRKGLGF